MPDLPSNLTVSYLTPQRGDYSGKVIALVLDKNTTAVYACAYAETHEDARLLALARYFKETV